MTGGAAGVAVFATGAAGFAEGGTAMGFGSGFAGAGAVACCFFASSSFSTSPGLLTCDQSILVSKSLGRPALLAEAELSPPPRICARTFSAS